MADVLAGASASDFVLVDFAKGIRMPFGAEDLTGYSNSYVFVRHVSPMADRCDRPLTN